MYNCVIVARAGGRSRSKQQMPSVDPSQMQASPQIPFERQWAWFCDLFLLTLVTFGSKEKLILTHCPPHSLLF